MHVVRAARGAYNMHGSLLTEYRGRVATNWPAAHGAAEAGAPRRAVAAKGDAGALAGPTAVPVRADDSPTPVSGEVTVAGEPLRWPVTPTSPCRQR
ncbi:formyltransferase family protein, partial [Burkholderia pseudomallei]|uniref:formyltransferase family protein n=1 Tax=Burkholderia pseudomallei TaxID=28450 RepID=UPI0027E3F53B